MDIPVSDDVGAGYATLMYDPASQKIVAKPASGVVCTGTPPAGQSMNENWASFQVNSTTSASCSITYGGIVHSVDITTSGLTKLLSDNTYRPIVIVPYDRPETWDFFDPRPCSEPWLYVEPAINSDVTLTFTFNPPMPFPIFHFSHLDISYTIMSAKDEAGVDIANYDNFTLIAHNSDFAFDPAQGVINSAPGSTSEFTNCGSLLYKGVLSQLTIRGTTLTRGDTFRMSISAQDLAPPRTMDQYYYSAPKGTMYYPVDQYRWEKQQIFSQESALAPDTTAFFNIKDYGAVGNGLADDTAAVQAAVDAVRAIGGGTVWAPPGTYLITSTIDLYQKKRLTVNIRGSGIKCTTFTTNADIVVFLHESYSTFEDFSVVQKGTPKTGRAFSTNAAIRTAYRRLYIIGFKYAMWWRFSIWASVTDVHTEQCVVGIKASRNDFPDDPTNPPSPGWWNSPNNGLCHNQDVFTNVNCSDGEVGIWGSFAGAVFNGVAFHRQNQKGENNVCLMPGTPGIGLFLQGMGTGLSKLGGNSNVIVNFYSEITSQPMVFEQCQVSLISYFAGGSEDSSDKSEQIIKATNVTLNAEAVRPMMSGHYKHRLVLEDSVVYGDPGGITSQVTTDFSGSYVLTNTQWYKRGCAVGFNETVTVSGEASTPVFTALQDCNTYMVEIMGHDGSKVCSARFQVAFWDQRTAARIISDPGNSNDLACTVTGTTLYLNTLSSSSNYRLQISVIPTRRLGNFPYVGFS